MNLANKVAIVTGSGGMGRGRAIARRFSREGAKVVVSDINPAGGKDTLRLIEAEGGQSVFFPVDLRAADGMRERGGGAIVNIASVSALGHGRKHAEVPAYDLARSGLIRLTTTLGILGKRDNIRVNCLAPGWIAVPEVQAYVDSLNPEQHAQRGVPNTLITIDEIADAVVQLATDETLAGRVIVWWNDEPPGFIPVGDPGYERLE